ncbi:rhomboid family intramembrane serine protease [bacterium]|nr:rhomboid family intramembrane serine protease [bacterium]
MGLYSRDYYREISASPWGFDGAPVVKWVIILNVVAFLATIFVTRPPRLTEKEVHDRMVAQKDQPLSQEEMLDLMRAAQRTSVVQEWGQLDTGKVIDQGQVWRLVTHTFLHDRYSIFHILFNMLALYWFGRTLEIMYGSREFLLFYLAAALCGAAAYVGLDLYTGSTVPAVGASGAVLGVMMLYTVHFPREEIFYCWFFPVQMRWLMALYVIWDLHPVLLALAGDRMYSGIGHAAHLGGLAFGFVYAWYEWRLEPLLDRVPLVGARTAADRPRLRARPSRPACHTGESVRDGGEVDRVLAKVSVAGVDSLTDDERAVLRAESARLKTRARG